VELPVKLELKTSESRWSWMPAANVIEVDPTAHVDMAATSLARFLSPATLPEESAGDHRRTGGVAADGNGFFHPG